MFRVSSRIIKTSYHIVMCMNTSIVCSTCGSYYCGKLLNRTATTGIRRVGSASYDGDVQNYVVDSPFAIERFSRRSEQRRGVLRRLQFRRDRRLYRDYIILCRDIDVLKKQCKTKISLASLIIIIYAHLAKNTLVTW